MSIHSVHEHAREFAGLPVVDWDPVRPIADPDGTAQRLTLGEARVAEGCLPAGGLVAKLLGRQPSPVPEPAPTFAGFLADPAAAKVRAIVISRWEGDVFFGAPPDAVIEELAAARGRLPSLRAIFLADVTPEENEISWITQGDISPLLAAYPDLEHLKVRGGNGLRFGALRHPRLRSLVVESGGLSGEVVREIAAADLPALEHLELWFGSADFGGDATVEDLRPMLAGDRFPKLRHLGLRDSEFSDGIAKLLATSPLARRVEVLDLSLGTLSDEGAEALITSGVVASLRRLDIHHHYCTDGMVRWLRSIGTAVDASDPQQADRRGDGKEVRYVAVGE